MARKGRKTMSSEEYRERRAERRRLTLEKYAILRLAQESKDA